MDLSALATLVKTYKSTYNIQIETKRNSHYYTCNGSKSYPSPTTYLNALQKGGLDAWRERTQVEAWAKEIQKACSLRASGDKSATVTIDEANSMFSYALDAPSRARDEAAKMGTDLHNALELYINEGRLPELAPELRAQFDMCLDFLSQEGITPIVAEMMVFNYPGTPDGELPWAGYGGTVDLLGLQQGMVTIVDWKTGQFYPHQQMQLSAYAEALTKGGIPVTRACLFSTKLQKSRQVDLTEGWLNFRKLTMAYSATRKAKIYE